MKIAIYFPKNIKIFIYINHTLHVFKKKCTRMDRDPTFERASMRNKHLSGPRAHGTPSACHSPTRRGGRRALATVVCMPAPHRTPPAGPDPAARLASLVICVERRNGSQGDGATAGGSVATTAHLISHRTEAPPESQSSPLSASIPSPPQLLVSVVWHQSSRGNGCSVGRRAGSARRLQPLKPSTFPPSDLSSFLVAWFVTLPQFSFVSRSVSAPVVQPGCVILPKESSTSQGAVSSMALEPIMRYFQMSSLVSLHALLHFRSPSPRRGLLFTNLLLQASENVRLCQNMDVRNSGPMSTSWMMMSRFGWQCSENLLCKCGLPPLLVCLNVKLNLLLCIVRGLKGLVAFLAEQPRQLKHLEWPGFQHTVCPLHWTLLRCLENCHDALLNIM